MRIDNPTKESVTQLKRIFDQSRDKRVAVVGTSCVGKSTLLNYIPQGVDMDTILFPLLTPNEEKEVSQSPWNVEMGLKMEKLARKYLQVQPGRPMFGTVVFDSDLIVHLRASEYLLSKRVQSRRHEYSDSVNMANWIEERVKSSGIHYISFILG